MITYVNTNSTDAGFNLACEYYAATTLADKLLNAGNAVFMLWITNPTLMLGKYQNVFEEINMPYAKNNNLALVRRMSGGGTIYTDLGGVQYTFITGGASVEICFERYTKPIITALRAMGAPVEFNGRNDLTVLGKKFSGNAQYIVGKPGEMGENGEARGVTVHHGSLLYDTDLSAIVEATTVRADKLESKSIKSVRERVTNLREHITDTCITSTGDFLHALKMAVCADSFVEYTLNEEDAELISNIANEKISNNAIIFQRSSNFTAKKTHKFDGGFVQLEFRVEHGKIADLRISGDYFAVQDTHLVERALIGVELNQNAIEQALCGAGLESAIHLISANELANMFVS